MHDVVSDFLQQHQLPAQYRQLIEEAWMPVAQALLARPPTQQPLLVGIHGAQGSGKSTMAAALALLLSQRFGQGVVVLSLDDLYLTGAERQRLGRCIHPLFRSRGVPGTHDAARGVRLLRQLQQARPAQQTRLPRFDKARDEPVGADQQAHYRGRPDIILFEGWCVATPPQTHDALEPAINALEATEDPHGIWRRHVNQQLAGPYQRLFAGIDCLIMLQAPDFASVYRWRSEQEDKLRQRQPQASGCMNATTLRRFIQHYERLTRHSLAVLPDKADMLLTLDAQRRVQDFSLGRAAL